MASSSNMISEGALVALVRSCPCLYDSNNEEYEDADKKAASWQAIANVLKASVVDVQESWKKLCDRYYRYRNNPHMAKSIDFSTKKLYEHMKFLEPRTQRRSLPNMPSTSRAVSATNTSLNSTNNLANKAATRLIKLVQEHPVLYDSSHINYRNKQTREEVWNTIGKVLNTSALQCRKKWSNIRKSFRKYIKCSSAIDSKLNKCHPYAKELKFLIPILAEKVILQTCEDQRKLIRKGARVEVIEIAETSDDDDDDISEDEIMQDLNHEVDSTVNDEGNSKSNKRSSEEQGLDSKKAKLVTETNNINSSVEANNADEKSDETDVKNESVNVEDTKQFEKLEESKRSYLEIQNLENNPDMLFFRSLLPELQLMTSQQKNKFRLAVLTSIDDIFDS